MKVPAWVKGLFGGLAIDLKSRKRREALAKRDRWYRRRCNVRLRPKRIAGWWVTAEAAVRPSRPPAEVLARRWRLDREAGRRDLARQSRVGRRLFNRACRSLRSQLRAAGAWPARGEGVR